MGADNVFKHIAVKEATVDTLSGTVEYDTSIESATAGGAKLIQAAASYDVPVFTFNDDTDTGIGSSAGDNLSFVAGGVELLRASETSNGVLLQWKSNQLTVTADVGSIQGGSPITTSFVVVSVCANAGDAVTLPATFQAGTQVKIKNNGAQSCDVFPASGDNLGAGADTQAALASGASITYIAITSNATWTSIGN